MNDIVLNNVWNQINFTIIIISIGIIDHNKKLKIW